MSAGQGAGPPVKDAPTVSVIITCYNLGRYLDEAIDSVLGQTFQDFEILVVDDGSTDPETQGLLADYRRPRTRVVRIDNRGLPGARNEGIRRTSGRYVCTLDADDRLEKSYFEKAVALLDRDPSIVFVSHWLRTFGDEAYDWTPDRADLATLLDLNTINGAALVRREALEAVGFLDESMVHGCEDWDLWISMVERGLRGVILPEVLFFYRRRPDSMSRLMMEGTTHVEIYRYLIRKHRASFETHLPELLLRREIDRLTLVEEVHALELDCEQLLVPETDRLREGLRVAAGKLQRLEDHDAADGELARHAAQLTDAETRLASLGRAVVAHETERRRNDETIARLTHEVQALRSSLSWRLTRPLRRVYGWLVRAG